MQGGHYQRSWQVNRLDGLAEWLQLTCGSAPNEEMGCRWGGSEGAGEGNEVIAVVELSEMTEGHRRSTDNHQINPKLRNFDF